MSFPPRPPPPIIQMGPMPPTMMPNPYGYPPMGMPPMGMPPMGMPPMMPRPIGPPSNYPIMNPGSTLKAALNQPITKVFVGNISERVPDPMIRSMLLRCGTVMSWKRVEGTSGKLQAFGFCEYDNPQSTLRCIRLLNGYQLADKKLLVKVDQKTHDLLAEYIKKNVQSNKNAKKSGLKNKKSSDDFDDDQDESSDKINLELADEETHREDRIVLNALELILKQYQKDLNPPPPEPVTPTAPVTTATTLSATPTITATSATPTTTTTNTVTSNKLETTNANSPLKPDDSHSQSTPNLSTVTNDKDKRDERSRSIDKSNRDRERSDRERDRDRGRIRGDTSPYSRDRKNSRSIERDPAKPSRYYDSPTRTRSRSPVDNRRTRRVSAERNTAHRDVDPRAKSPPSRYSRNNSDLNNKENTQKPVVTLTHEELEEERERKKLERRLREKEQAYRDRLKEWEERESKKRRQYLAEKKTEIQRRKQLQKEAKKLRQFMEDYEDDKDDSNFYKGSNLEKKLKAREKEIEADNRDRQREKEELEELKKKLSEKGGFADVEAEARKLHDDEHNRMKNKFEKLEQSSSSSSSSSSEDEDDEKEIKQDKNTIESDKTNGDELNEDNQVTTPSIEENANSIQQKQLSNDLNGASMSATSNSKNLMSDGDSNTSPTASNYVDSPVVTNFKSDQTNDNFLLSSPNSNSPLYLNNSTSIVNTNNHYLPPSTATHVTIKSFSTSSKNKSIQPIINKAFADEDDESNGPQMKRAKLAALNDSESKMNSEERKKAVKKLVESIPTDRDELFSYNVDWEQLDENLMEKRIKPWINKKIIEYIGEEEATLNDFICSKIQQRTNPEKLLEEVKVILDDEAELFIKKMWRLIVYETESKRQGLSK